MTRVWKSTCLWLACVPALSNDCIYPYLLSGGPATQLAEVTNYEQVLIEKMKRFGLNPAEFPEFELPKRRRDHLVRLPATRSKEWDAFLDWIARNDPDEEVFVAATFRLREAYPHSAVPLTTILDRLHHPEPRFRRVAIELLFWQYPHLSAAKGDELLEDPSGHVRAGVIEAIERAAVLDRMPKVLPFLSDPEAAVRFAALRAIYHLDWVDRVDPKRMQSAIEEFSDRPLGKQLQTYLLNNPRFHRLYEGLDFAWGPRDTFFDASQPVAVADFVKTGSETFLLSGKLAGKVIARVIPKESADKWREALESPHWRRRGFDYVPIEPILSLDEIEKAYGLDSVSMDKLRKLKNRASPIEGREVVFAKVLMGPTVWAMRLECEGPYVRKESREQMKRIEDTLKEIGIDHQHVKGDNFVVVREDGARRYYLIDFDQATDLRR